MLNFLELTDVGGKVIQSLKTPLTFLLLFLRFYANISNSYLERELKSYLLLMICFIEDDSSMMIGVMLASHADYYSI